MDFTEDLLFATILVLGLGPLIWLLLRSPRRRIGVLGLIFPALVLVAWSHSPTPDLDLTGSLPVFSGREGMRSSDSCQACHPDQYDTWRASFHRTMTQVAGPDSVVAPFDGRKLQARDRAFSVDRRGEQFWVTEVETGGGSRAIAAPRRVVMTTGSRHQQVYWTATSEGSLEQFPWVYEIAEGIWLPSAHSFLQPGDLMQSDTTWNRDCVRCHSSGPLPNYNFESAQWETQVTELGIACASCHGPAEKHIRVHRNPLHRHLHRASGRPDTTIVNPERLDKERSSEVCGQCHSFSVFYNGFHGDDWPAFRAGKELKDHFGLFMGAEHQNSFWSDGTSRIGGREYNAMILSGCYTKGEMTCLSCHKMHGNEPRDQLAPSMDDDEACLQCHADYRERIAEHTFHKVESSGSRCYNCHMPYTSYALLGAARAHRVDSPSAAGQTTTERPNACNLCHLDKTLAWTAEHLTKWYDTPPVQVSPDHREVAASVIWALRGDAAQRSLAGWHMGQTWALEASGDGWETPYLARLLVDPYSATRLIAHRSLRRVTGGETIPFDHVGPTDQRVQVSQAVLTRWAEERSADRPVPAPETLIFENGRVRWNRFNELYLQRDNRRLYLSE